MNVCCRQAILIKDPFACYIVMHACFTTCIIAAPAKYSHLLLLMLANANSGN